MPAPGQPVGPDGGTVVSDDGNFEVRIPPGALAETVNIEISILEASDVGLDAGDDFAGPIYGLAPDGLEFAAPATTVRTVNAEAAGAADATVPFMFVFQGDDGGWEALDTSTTRDGDVLQIVANITHFSANLAASAATVYGAAAIHLEPAPGLPTPVGGSFDTDLIVTGLGDLSFHEAREILLASETFAELAVVAFEPQFLLLAQINPVQTTCGMTPGTGEYGMSITFRTSKVPVAIPTAFERVFSALLLDPEEVTTATLTASTSTECIESDLSVGDSAVGSSDCTLFFEPAPEAGGTPFEATCFFTVDIVDGTYTVTQVQLPQNQKTTGAMDPVTGKFFAVGGEDFFQMYLGTYCPRSDGPNLFLGSVLGGPPSLREDIEAVLGSLPNVTDGPSAAQAFASGIPFVEVICPTDVPEALEQAAELRSQLDLGDAQPGFDFIFVGIESNG